MPERLMPVADTRHLEWMSEYRVLSMGEDASFRVAGGGSGWQVAGAQRGRAKVQNIKRCWVTGAGNGSSGIGRSVIRS
ncbi:MAG: hypothetical protein RL303_1394, partial [Verrucomicrobiota bacterium]